MAPERSSLMPPGPRIAVIGAGAAGAITALHLLRAARDGEHAEVVLIDPSRRTGRGVAYGTSDPGHLLNVRAGDLSVSASDPGGFVRHLEATHDDPPGPGDFATRSSYGDYVERSLHREVARARDRGAGRLTRVQARAVALAPSRAGYVISLSDGRRLAARAVVIATGALGAKRLPGAAGLDGDPRLIDDPWTGDLRTIAREDEVLVVGSGLTAVDTALSLRAGRPPGHGPRVTLVSRSGRLPAAHGAAGGPRLAPPPIPVRPTVAGLRRSLRAAVGRAEAAGADWRAAVDSFRPVTPAIWRRMEADERRRAVADRCGWGVLRHRMAPEAAAALARERANGGIRVARVDVEEIADGGGALDVTLGGSGAGGRRVVRTRALIACTGLALDPRAAGSALLVSLMRRGLVAADPLGLGLRVTSAGALIAADGGPSSALLVVGALRSGEAWESTAIPEIRVQAAEVAAAAFRVARAVPVAGGPDASPLR